MLCAFDCDGTLADSRPIYYRAVYEYAQRNGFPFPSKEQMDLVFGDPEPGLIFTGWDQYRKGQEENERPAYQVAWASETPFRAHLGNVYALTDDLICTNPGEMPLYEGVFELLKALSEEGVPLAIVTSRSKRPVDALLDHHGIRDFFQSVWTGTDVEEGRCRGKPYPDKLHGALQGLDPAYVPASQGRDAMMIGDTHMDIKMARDAGVRPIGVAWGYHLPEVLRAHGAEAVALDTGHLRKLLV